MRKLGILASLFLTLSCGVHKMVVHQVDGIPEVHQLKYCGIHVTAITPDHILIANENGQVSQLVSIYGEKDGLIVSPAILEVMIPTSSPYQFTGKWLPRYNQWLWFQVKRHDTEYCFFKVFLKTR